jgi:hypothetical protein
MGTGKLSTVKTKELDDKNAVIKELENNRDFVTVKVTDDGKNVVATDKNGNESVFDIVKNKIDEVKNTIATAIKGKKHQIGTAVGGALAGLLLMGCVTAPRVEHTDTNYMRNLVNGNSRVTERVIADAPETRVNARDRVYGITIADRIASGNMRIADLMEGGMSAEMAAALVPLGTQSRGVILNKLTGNGLSRREAAEFVKGDVTMDLNAIQDMAKMIIAEINLDPIMRESKDAFLLRVRREGINPTTYKGVVLWGLKEILSAIDFAVQQSDPEQLTVGIGEVNEALKALNEFLKGAPGLGTTDALKFLNDRLIRHFAADLPQSQGVTARWEANLQARKGLANDPVSAAAIALAKQANADIRTMLVNGYKIQPQLILDIVELSQLILNTTTNVAKIQEAYAQLFEKLHTLRATAPAEQHSGGSGGSTQDGGTMTPGGDTPAPPTPPSPPGPPPGGSDKGGTGQGVPLSFKQEINNNHQLA